MQNKNLSYKDILGGYLGRLILTFWFFVGGFRAVWKRLNKALLEKFKNEDEKHIAIAIATEVTIHQTLQSLLKDFFNMDDKKIEEISNKVVDYLYQLLQNNEKNVKKDKNIEYYV